jgi:hypothetical protein
MAIRIGYKVYVDVFAVFTAEGELRPKYLIWEDGTKYEIDRIKKRERCASLRAGGIGILYVCMVRGREIRLFYEENYRWFLEAKEA